MHRRKIQLVAGSTYSVSLPKDWVLKNKLKEHDEIILEEELNGKLIISPTKPNKKELTELTLEIDEYLDNIDQIIFAAYYIGVEKITLTSNTGITKEIKSNIRKTVSNMSGTEIYYEDKKEIIITVLLDKSKVNIIQALYRIYLLIESSILNLTESIDLSEIQLNEAEIDRLYHLISKMVSLSILDQNILRSSKIDNTLSIPSYFLISKRLENIGDIIKKLAPYLKQKDFLDKYKEILLLIKEELSRSIKHIMKKPESIFTKTKSNKVKNTKEQIKEISDTTICNFLKEMVRFMVDIQEEIVNMSFYEKLIREKII